MGRSKREKLRILTSERAGKPTGDLEGKRGGRNFTKEAEVEWGGTSQWTEKESWKGCGKENRPRWGGEEKNGGGGGGEKVKSVKGAIPFKRGLHSNGQTQDERHLERRGGD